MTQSRYGRLNDNSGGKFNHNLENTPRNDKHTAYETKTSKAQPKVKIQWTDSNKFCLELSDILFKHYENIFPPLEQRTPGKPFGLVAMFLAFC